MSTKKIVTKVGDVCRIELDHSKGYFVQLVTLDPVNMNSDVVVVYEGGDTPHPANNETMVFYTHTTLAQGIKEGIWKKVGNYSVTLDIAKLTFKNYFGADFVEIEAASGPSEASPPIPYPNWTVWSPVDQEWRFVTEEEGIRIPAEDGSIFPASDVIYRIRHGESEFTPDWPSNSGNLE